MYCYVWEFRVRDQQLASFVAAYGPEGHWVQLFRRASGYLRTELFRDLDDPARFVTVDYWTSREAALELRVRFRNEFEALDAQGEEYTLEERQLGEFEVLSRA